MLGYSLRTLRRRLSNKHRLLLLLMLLQTTTRLGGMILDPVPETVATKALVRPANNQQTLVVATVTNSRVHKVRILLGSESEYLNPWHTDYRNCRRANMVIERRQAHREILGAQAIAPEKIR